MTLSINRLVQQFQFAGLLMVLFSAMPARAEDASRLKRFPLLTNLAAVPQASRENLRTQRIFGRVQMPEDWDLEESVGDVILSNTAADPERIPKENDFSGIGASVVVKIRVIPNLHPNLQTAFAAQPLELGSKPVPAEKVNSTSLGIYPALRTSQTVPEPEPGISHRREVDGRLVPFAGVTNEFAYLLWVRRDVLAYVEAKISYVEPFADYFIKFRMDLTQILESLVFETDSVLVEGFDGTDRHSIPLTFRIKVFDNGKPASEKPVGIAFLNSQYLKPAVAVWEENGWRVIEDPTIIGQGYLSEKLEPKTNKDGEILLRLFLDFGKTKLFPPKLPLSIGLRAFVAGKFQGPLIEAEATILVRHAAFLCGAYFSPPGQPFQHLSDLPAASLTGAMEPRPWDFGSDGKSRLLNSIPRDMTRTGPTREAAANSIVLNGQEITRWTELETLRSGFLPLEQSSVIELNALADDDPRSLSYFPKGSSLGTRILWLDGTEGVLTVRAPGRLAARIETLPNYRLTESGQRAESLVYLLVAEIPETIMEFGVVSAVSFVAGPVAAIVVSEGIDSWGQLKIRSDVINVLLKSPNARLILIRSRFTLTHDESGNEVLEVMEGSPQYSIAGSAPITISPGQRMVRPKNGQPRLETAVIGEPAANRLSTILTETSVRPRVPKTVPAINLETPDRDQIVELCKAVLERRASETQMMTLSRLTANGPPWIWTVLGIAYDRGTGLPQSAEIAGSCYRMAAEKGDVWGEYRLGRYLLGQVRSGQTTEGINKEAIMWLEKAGEAGYAPALLELGLCAREGVAITQSPEQAFRWFLKAAELGNPRAQSMVGECYLFGIAVPESRVEAHNWFERAAGQGLAAAQYFAYFTAPDQSLASNDARWLRLAATQGHAEAQETLARELLGQEDVATKTEAIGWLNRAVKGRRASAAELLGDLCSSGQVVPRNVSSARDWYLEAIRIYEADFGENAAPFVDMVDAKVKALE
jgi:TPR repeat protein